jgi:heat shock protein HslJ
MPRNPLILPAIAALVLVACRKPAADPPGDTPSSPPATPTPSATPGQLVGHGWVLVQLGDRANPLGAGDKPPTITFDGTRASGFAGCNRFSGNYMTVADSLSFGALMSTKMACPGSDQVEVGYLAALSASRTFVATDNALTLRDSLGTAVAGFKRE